MLRPLCLAVLAVTLAAAAPAAEPAQPIFGMCGIKFGQQIKRRDLLEEVAPNVWAVKLAALKRFIKDATPGPEVPPTPGVPQDFSFHVFVQLDAESRVTAITATDAVGLREPADFDAAFRLFHATSTALHGPPQEEAAAPEGPEFGRTAAWRDAEGNTAAVVLSVRATTTVTGGHYSPPSRYLPASVVPYGLRPGVSRAVIYRIARAGR